MSFTMMHPPRRMAGRWILLALLVSWSFFLVLPHKSHSSRHRYAHGGSLAVRCEAGESTPDSDMPDDDKDPNERRAEILAELGVKAWHAQGHKGQGVKVAILDTGFCGYRAHLGKALPAQVTARSFRTDGNLEAKDSQHGILCGEVIHALAPDAQLLFANWDADRPDQFLEAIHWARTEGARVISCSVIMPSWSDGEGGGKIHERLAKFVGPGEQPDDLLMFASAGNTAQRHWGGAFHDAGDGWLDWGQGTKENVIHPWGGERVSVELCCQPGARYDLFVEDVSLRQAAGRCSCRAGDDRCCCVTRFTPQAGHVYTLKVRQTAGKPGLFHLVVLGGGLQYASRKGSIPFPGDGPEVIAVGAVNHEGHRLAYSSCGPNSPTPKPDFVASIPFPSLWRTRPFTGTSAAAPQAAGLAALVLARHPDWTAHRVREALQSSVHHLDGQPHSCETGFGQLHLP
jgi:Subtilase family